MGIGLHLLVNAIQRRVVFWIDGAHAALDWVPIRYVNQGYARDELAGVYRAAKIGLVTPLRDGMNLVAKEYVACQSENKGVLILSEMAGAAAS